MTALSRRALRAASSGLAVRLGPAVRPRPLASSQTAVAAARSHARELSTPPRKPNGKAKPASKDKDKPLYNFNTSLTFDSEPDPDVS